MAERAQRDVVGRPRADARESPAAPGVRRRGRGRGRARCRRRPAPRTARPAPGRGRAASAGPRGRAPASVAASGNRWVSPSTGCATGRPCCGDQPRRDGARAGDADLLAEHRADGDLVAVDVAGHAQPGPAPAPADRSPGRRRTRRRPRPGRSRRRAAGGPARSRRAVSRRSSSANVAVTNAVCRGSATSGISSRTVPGAVRQREGPGVPALARRLDARHRAQRRGSRAARCRRTACVRRAASSTAPVVAPAAAAAAQVGRRGRVDLADRVVELPHAGEAGRERDVGVRQVGRLDQHPRGLRAAGPGQRQRAGAELGGEQPGRGAAACSRPGRPGPRRPRGRRRRRRSAASPGRPRSRRRPSPGCPASRRAGSACRRGSRRPGRTPRSGGR